MSSMVKELCVAFDSDGCVLDVMETKHRDAFFPALGEVWDLSGFQSEARTLWLNINLYSKTRGANRFLALEIFLRGIADSFGEASAVFRKDADALEQWMDDAETLSEESLSYAIDNRRWVVESLERALSWSRLVNVRVGCLPPPKMFEGVLPVLQRLKDMDAFVCVVSSAKGTTIAGEWQHVGLSKYVDKIYGQEDGSKAEVLGMISSELGRDCRILMVGDALGDLRAAKSNDVEFYPIIPRSETESWRLLFSESLECFLSDQSFFEKTQKQRIDFLNALS